MNRPVRSPAQAIGTAELRAFLEKALSPHVAPPRRLIELECRPSIYSTSFAMEELDVRLDDDTRLRLLYKDLSRHALLEDARQAKPTFLYDPLREIETYRSILGPNRLGTAECYGAIVDPSVERYGLLLEKVPGLELYQVGDLATWRRVSEWLAIMHKRFSGQTGQLVRTAPCCATTATSTDCGPTARASLGRSGPRLSREARRGMEQLFGDYDRVIGHLVALPVTFLHGEFYASNVLVCKQGEGLRVCPLPVVSTSIPKGRQRCLSSI
jgi:hypothetical protein